MRLQTFTDSFYYVQKDKNQHFHFCYKYLPSKVFHLAFLVLSWRRNEQIFEIFDIIYSNFKDFVMHPKEYNDLKQLIVSNLNHFMCRLKSSRLTPCFLQQSSSCFNAVWLLCDIFCCCWHQGRLIHKLWCSRTPLVLINTAGTSGMWRAVVEIIFCPACFSGLGL